MTTANPGNVPRSIDLDSTRLRTPGLQADTLTLRAIEPSPCTEACPAGINVKSYVSLIAEGRFAEALEVVRERCPLPGICGRICHHPCETACKRDEVEAPVGIRALKRFIADLELELDPPQPTEIPAPTRDESVAIIGSGPAGLTAGYDLARAGYRVTIFEGEPEPGGMLRYGIADYRLPPEILDAEIDYLKRSGIEIRTGCRIGEDVDLETLLEEEYSAAIFAVGAQNGRRLGLEGEAGCDAVEDALAFLRRVNLGDRTPVTGKVLVIGGGSTAIEAARSALRLGADEVEIVYRRHRDQMPADEEEIEVAEAEGIGFRLLTAPARVVAENGRLQGLECLEVALGEPDDSGRRRPIPIPGSEFVIAADRILAAIGQEARFDFLPDEVVERVADRGLLAVDAATAMTALRGVFAAGDVVTGPSTVIDAVAAGHDVAESVRAFLEGEEYTPPAPSSERFAPTEYEIPPPSPPTMERLKPIVRPVVDGHEFDEVEQVLSAANAIAEAQRCLRCGPCAECRICASTCGHRHVTLHAGNGADDGETLLLRTPTRFAAGLEGYGQVEGWLLPDETSPEGYTVDLTTGVVSVDEEHCRGCARCVLVCPFDAISLVDETAPETTAHVSPTLCRGCNLCVAICPTDAAASSVESPQWWGTRLDDLYRPFVETEATGGSCVIVTCQRRAAGVEASIAQHNVDAELAVVRCAGELDAGQLLEIYRTGADAVLVAGCLSDHCRYGDGSQMAVEQLRRAHEVLRSIGGDPSRLVADWARSDNGSPFYLPLLQLVTRAETLADEIVGDSTGA